jgi:hypothetical protein
LEDCYNNCKEEAADDDSEDDRADDFALLRVHRELGNVVWLKSRVSLSVVEAFTSKLDETRKVGRYDARGNEEDKGARDDNGDEPDDEANE